MADRFVSGGTINPAGETLKDSRPHDDGYQSQEKRPAKNPEWEAVQQELEAERKRREEKRAEAVQGEEKSLYDILQANKAAKQAAFEEQNKIRNQFRALDDDEVDFLDEVRASKRREEEATKRETEEGLRAFRERRVVDSGVAAEDAEGDEEWAVTGRKRRRGKEKTKDAKGTRRKLSGAAAAAAADDDDDDDDDADDKEEAKEMKREERVEVKTTPSAKKGLVDYGSDDSDDGDE